MEPVKSLGFAGGIRSVVTVGPFAAHILNQVIFIIPGGFVVIGDDILVLLGIYSVPGRPDVG
ncbi:hypothetical protein D3C74_433830 [compost metagenome]